MRQSSNRSRKRYRCAGLLLCIAALLPTQAVADELVRLNIAAFE